MVRGEWTAGGRAGHWGADQLGRWAQGVVRGGPGGARRASRGNGAGGDVGEAKCETDRLLKCTDFTRRGSQGQRG